MILLDIIEMIIQIINQSKLRTFTFQFVRFHPKFFHVLFQMIHRSWKQVVCQLGAYRIRQSIFLPLNRFQVEHVVSHSQLLPFPE